MIRIISGGQTGVDRAALDAALECGIDCGGWCPEGRKAEDGKIADVYPLTELYKAGYRERTRQNVIDSDATLIIYFGYPTGGTELTIRFCISEKKPYVLIDAEEFMLDAAVLKVEKLIHDKSVTTLNVAGPRASGEPGAYNYAKDLIKKVIQNVGFDQHQPQ